MGGHGTESGEPVRRIGPYRVVATLGERPVPGIAAAYPAGSTLHEAVTGLGVFTEDAARALLAELARAVPVIHDAGLVHRDHPRGRPRHRLRHRPPRVRPHPDPAGPGPGGTRLRVHPLT